MQARGMLMIEHRLIERMIALISKKAESIRYEKKLDPVFVDTAVDFIRVYADRTHHGKEEDILFRDLEQRSLSEEDKRVMQELIDDHVFGRKTTKALVDANARYRDGDTAALADIAVNLETLADFYPRHIEKEDNVFFPAARKYFTDAEDQAMVDEFLEFDRKMIHEKYETMVSGLEEA
ncbi:MAG: hemerythrin domain-containing protein [Thermodesulfobacteriota bacterium]|nr:hemerythrin domain-containing protein [Thermodesulfobacteriota bacterium]